MAHQHRISSGIIAPLLRRFAGRQAEDCLYLNVWTPSLGPAARPVMVFLHGGAFLLGSGSTFVYDGRHLARRGDVVVVTLNYRLGALGFLDPTHLDADEGSGVASNLGLRDQLAALSWVRDNAASFGGDPANVTVFGESAGAMSLGGLLASPAAQGLFRRAILQSGAAANVVTPETAERQGRAFLEALDLRRFDVEALREMPAATLLEAQQRSTRPADDGSFLPWQPVYGDDLLPQPPLTAIAGGAAAGIELLVGTNADEWKLFTAARRRLQGLEEDGLVARTKRLLRRHGLEHVEPERVIEIYRAGRPAGTSPYELYVALRTDEVFRIPALELLEAQAPHEPRVFAYRLDLPVPSMPDFLGACHGVDLPLLFGTYDHPYLLPFFLHRRSVRQLSERMQDAWTAFARRGSPAHGSVGPWPPWDPVARKTLLLDRRCTLERAPHEAERRLWSGAEAPGMPSPRPAPAVRS